MPLYQLTLTGAGGSGGHVVVEAADEMAAVRRAARVGVAVVSVSPASEDAVESPVVANWEADRAVPVAAYSSLASEANARLRRGALAALFWGRMLFNLGVVGGVVMLILITLWIAERPPGTARDWTLLLVVTTLPVLVVGLGAALKAIGLLMLHWVDDGRREEI